MRKNLAFTFAFVTIALLAAGAALAGKFNKVVSIGDVAPAFAGIEGTDGKQHSLADYKSAKVVVEIFTCNHCPVARQYDERLMQLQKEYQAKGVQFVAICVNKGEEDNLAAMKVHAEESKLNYPYLSDPSQAAGRAMGAQKTPHVFVLDAQRKIVYMGGIDDNWSTPEAVTKHFLRDAIEAALAGRTPEVTETRAAGCGIEYE